MPSPGVQGAAPPAREPPAGGGRDGSIAIERKTRHHVADAHAGISKPAAMHLQHVPCWLASAPDLVRQSRQLHELHDATGRIEKGGRQGQRCVTHPQTANAIGRKHEQHPLIVRHRNAMHQTCLLLTRGPRDLDLKRSPTGIERDARQIQLLS